LVFGVRKGAKMREYSKSKMEKRIDKHNILERGFRNDREYFRRLTGKQLQSNEKLFTQMKKQYKNIFKRQKNIKDRAYFLRYLIKERENFCAFFESSASPDFLQLCG
jgi:DNA polymerase III delta prime subunit